MQPLATNPTTLTFSPLKKLLTASKINSPYEKNENPYLVNLQAAYHLQATPKKILLLNTLIGKKIQLEYQNALFCTLCKKSLKKNPPQGYCYHCFTSKPQADICTVKPETCHYQKGTCRSPQWGEKNCFITHTLYIAYASHIKIGITRHFHKFSRWMDQGALIALPIATTKSRLTIGQAEKCLSSQFSDKTNWRIMLKSPPSLPLAKQKELRHLLLSTRNIAHKLLEKNLPNSRQLHFEKDPTSYVFHYPQEENSKINLTSLDIIKLARFQGKLMGIKGHYLLFPQGVFNTRKFAACKISLSILP